MSNRETVQSVEKSPASLDVLIITAADGEDEAVRLVETGSLGKWQEIPGPPNYGFKVWRNHFRSADGGQLSIGLSRSIEMGGEGTANAAARLVDAYKPRCLAMSGVCAGNPARLRLGDVIIADRVWRYDVGAQLNSVPGNKPTLHADMTTYQLNAQWKQAAEQFSFRPAVCEERPRERELQANWLLRELLEDRNPLDSPDKNRLCCDWTAVVEQLQKQKMISIKSGAPLLSKRGRDVISEVLFRERGQLPEPPPWRIAVGPMGTGNNLVKDVDVWDHLGTRQRHVLGLDMEGSVVGFTAYTQNVQHILVVKGVMDYAEPGRTQGFRHFAARAAAEVMLAFLRQQLKSEVRSTNLKLVPSQKTHPRVVEPPIKDSFSRHKQLVLPISELSLQAYSQIFYSLCSNFRSDGSKDRFLWRVSEFIHENESKTPLAIKGAPGTGKTTLLRLLETLLCEKYSRSQVVYFNPRFLDEIHFSKNQKNYERTIVEILEAELGALNDKNQLDSSCVFLADGFNEYVRAKVPMVQKYYADFVRRLTVTKRIVAVGIVDQKDGFARKLSDPDLPDQCQQILKLEPVSVFDEEKYPIVLDAWCQLAPVQLVELQEIIERFRISEVDLATLSFLTQTIKNQREDSETLSVACRRFVLDQIRDVQLRNPEWAMGSSKSASETVQLEEGLKLHASGVFKTFVESSVDSSPLDQLAPDELQKTVAWSAVSSHPLIRDFMVAVSIVEQLQGSVENSEKILLKVFPHNINRNCKELISRSESVERRVFENIAKICTDLAASTSGVRDEHHWVTMTHCGYLLGRTSSTHLRTKARDLLFMLKRRFIDDTEQKAKEAENGFLLFQRTIFISLIVLGEKSASNEYVARLIESGVWDNLNRGFHLEYYGDTGIDYRGQTLQNDRLSSSFRRTLSRLEPKLRKSLLSEEAGGYAHELFEVELHTLCSMAQHRHVRPFNLEDGVRESVRKLAIFAVQVHTFSCEKLRSYVRTCVVHLQNSHFDAIAPMAKMIELAERPRWGWKEHLEVDVFDSVGGHVFTTWLLARLMLPPTHLVSGENAEPERFFDNDLAHEASEYSKERILDLLVAHDLAEAITGDIPKSVKDANPKHARAEESWMEYIGALSAYGQFFDTFKLQELYSEFEKDKTVNARIAKDIDRLDIVAKLYFYRPSLHESVLNKWELFRDRVASSIRTTIGKRLLAAFVNFYTNKRGPDLYPEPWEPSSGHGYVANFPGDQ